MGASIILRSCRRSPRLRARRRLYLVPKLRAGRRDGNRNFARCNPEDRGGFGSRQLRHQRAVGTVDALAGIPLAGCVCP